MMNTAKTLKGPLNHCARSAFQADALPIVRSEPCFSSRDYGRGSWRATRAYCNGVRAGRAQQDDCGRCSAALPTRLDSMILDHRMLQALALAHAEPAPLAAMRLHSHNGIQGSPEWLLDSGALRASGDRG